MAVQQKDKTTLLAQAAVVRDETTDAANDAKRIGTLFYDIIENLAQLVDVASASGPGLMSAEMVTKLNSLSTSVASLSTELDGKLGQSEKYVHPLTHSAGMITPTLDKQFVSGDEKRAYNEAVSKIFWTSIPDLIAKLKVPSKTSQLINDSHFLTEHQDISQLVADIANAVKKEDGKGLSQENFTTALLQKLNGIAARANNYVHPVSHPASMIVPTLDRQFVTPEEKQSWNNAVSKIFWSTIPDLIAKLKIPTKMSDLPNDSGYLTQHQSLEGYVEKQNGMGLSHNDYTDIDKDVVDRTKEVIDRIESDYTEIEAIVDNVPLSEGITDEMGYPVFDRGRNLFLWRVKYLGVMDYVYFKQTAFPSLAGKSPMLGLTYLCNGISYVGVKGGLLRQGIADSTGDSNEIPMTQKAVTVELQKISTKHSQDVTNIQGQIDTANAKHEEDVNSIQSQIDRIVAGNTRLSVSSSLGDFFEGKSNPITITARLSSGNGIIKIYRGSKTSGEPVRTSQGKVSVLDFTETITTTTSYCAVAEVTGGTVNGNAVTAHGYLPVYVGAGVSATAVAGVPRNKQTVRSTPAGKYSMHVNDNDYVFVLCPNNMSVKEIIMDRQQFLYKQMQNETINGVNYKVYRSTNSFNACDIVIVVS